MGNAVDFDENKQLQHLNMERIMWRGAKPGNTRDAVTKTHDPQPAAWCTPERHQQSDGRAQLNDRHLKLRRVEQPALCVTCRRPRSHEMQSPRVYVVTGFVAARGAQATMALACRGYCKRVLRGQKELLDTVAVDVVIISTAITTTTTTVSITTTIIKRDQIKRTCRGIGRQHHRKHCSH